MDLVIILWALYLQFEKSILLGRFDVSLDEWMDEYILEILLHDDLLFLKRLRERSI